ncbi:MAG: FkbM family methyltransferase [Actinobacteria bacterium]|nr:FkbM family methyltransferase [Actinomycetota bacterium]
MHRTPVVLGRRVELDGGDTDEYLAALVDGKPFEDSPLTIVDRLLAGVEDATLVDVGANLGVHAVALALAHPACHVVAIEANPKVLPWLRTNVTRNGCENVEIVGCAVSDAEGEIEFFTNVNFPAGSGMLNGSADELAAVIKNHPSGAELVEKVGMRRLDDILDPNRQENVRVLKIDVEGHDIRVLRGAPNLLAAHPVVVMEFATLAITLHAGMLPSDVIREVRRQFEYVYVIGAYGHLRRIESETDVVDFLSENAVRKPVQDLLCCSAESPLLGRVQKLAASGSEKPTAPSATASTVEPMGENILALRAELTAVQEELVRVRQSVSWRVTRPLRAVRRRIGQH